MKLTIQDFGLYLGAPCQIVNHPWAQEEIEMQKEGYPPRYNFIDGVELHRGQYWIGMVRVNNGWFHIQNVTPILRHINSLTESEARELYEVTHGRKFDMVVPPDLMSGQTALGWFRHAVYWRIDPMSANIGNTAGWRWLLAHYFDLFGWIEAGLALDAAKQEQPPKTA